MVIKRLREYGFNTDNRTYVIAEIGINHRGDVNVAKELIDSAVRSGVDAVKFQTYITENRVPDDKTEIFEILKELELPFEAFNELKEYSMQNGVDFFSTPFDRQSVEYLESIGVNLYKIASFDVTNLRLLSDVAKTGKPIVLSVGMSNLDEIREAYKVLNSGTDNIAILHCISSYPTIEQDANLSNIYRLQKEFKCVIGHSDHTNDIDVPLYAVAAGAQIIEKHFKVDDNFECIDSPVSITETQMKELVENIRRIESIFGNEEFGVRDAEKGIEPFRRKTN